MLVVFDLNKTLINKRKRSDGSLKIQIRPFFKELYDFLIKNKIKIGIWSFCTEKNFTEIIKFLGKKGFTDFFILKNEYKNSKTLRKSNEIHKLKKDLEEISIEKNIPLKEIILIEDDEVKCVDFQKRIIVRKFKNLLDSEFLNVKEIIKNLLNI